MRLSKTRVRNLAMWVMVCALCACQRPAEQSGDRIPNVTWTPVEVISPPLPSAIEVWEGEDEDLPLKAWYVRIDLTSDEVDIEVLSSTDSDGRQSSVDFAQQSGACIVVNGGYFKVVNDFYSHIGLLISDGKFVHSATPGVFKNDLRYPVMRSAIGFNSRNEPQIGWVSSKGKSAFIWEAPLDNIPGEPALVLNKDSETEWDVVDAIEAGPALLSKGAAVTTVDEEVFFGTTIPDIHPRTAAGIDADGRLILMVVDGRQRNSRGVSLEELGKMMQGVGAVDAINLDGGGSSTLIARDQLLNLPTGGTFQREIVSAIGIFCRNDSD